MASEKQNIWGAKCYENLYRKNGENMQSVFCFFRYKLEMQEELK